MLSQHCWWLWIEQNRKHKDHLAQLLLVPRWEFQGNSCIKVRPKPKWAVALRIWVDWNCGVMMVMVPSTTPVFSHVFPMDKDFAHRCAFYSADSCRGILYHILDYFYEKRLLNQPPQWKPQITDTDKTSKTTRIIFELEQYYTLYFWSN